jgi:heme-degrading monooxygenase HmoA
VDKLFRKVPGYINTELLRDETNPNRYVTVDCWETAESYEAFRAQFNKEYETLDAQCERLTKQESLLGKWESIVDETR